MPPQAALAARAGRTAARCAGRLDRRRTGLGAGAAAAGASRHDPGQRRRRFSGAAPSHDLQLSLRPGRCCAPCPHRTPRWPRTWTGRSFRRCSRSAAAVARSSTNSPTSSPAERCCCRARCASHRGSERCAPRASPRRRRAGRPGQRRRARAWPSRRCRHGRTGTASDPQRIACEAAAGPAAGRAAGCAWRAGAAKGDAGEHGAPVLENGLCAPRCGDCTTRAACGTRGGAREALMPWGDGWALAIEALARHPRRRRSSQKV